MLKLPFQFSLLALLSGALLADTITLKSGEKLEGKILSETDTELTVQVRITATITDEQAIKKADIDKIERVTADEAAWAAIKGLALGAESLEPSDYRRAQGALQGFIASHPQSKYAAEAKQKLAAFEAEAKRVEAGEMKIGGKWLTQEEVAREKKQITGRRLTARMKQLAAASQLSEAMNVFAALEKDAAGSASFPDAVETARQVLPLLKTAAEQRRAQIKAQAEEGKRRLAATEGAERQQLERIQKQQAENTEAAVAAFERSQLQWLPLNPATEKSLAALANKAASKLSDVQRTDTAKMRTSLALAASASAALATGDPEKAEKDYREAQSAWSSNELLERLQPQIASARKAAMEAKVAADRAASEAAAAAAKATPTPKPAPVQESAASEPITEEPEAKKEVPFYTAPVFWISLVIVAGLALTVRKFLGKFSDPNKNILDQ